MSAHLSLDFCYLQLGAVVCRLMLAKVKLNQKFPNVVWVQLPAGLRIALKHAIVSLSSFPSFYRRALKGAIQPQAIVTSVLYADSLHHPCLL